MLSNGGEGGCLQLSSAGNGVRELKPHQLDSFFFKMCAYIQNNTWYRYTANNMDSSHVTLTPTVWWHSSDSVWNHSAVWTQFNCAKPTYPYRTYLGRIL